MRPSSFLLLLTALLLMGTTRRVSGASQKNKMWSPDVFPNPKRDTYLCGRGGRKSSMCDPDGVLSEKAANRLEGIIRDIEDGHSPYREASCASLGMQGYQVAVAVMKKMKIEGETTPKEMAETFAKVLHARWGVGLAECDNGVLVLLSVDDKQIYISTGVKAAESLPPKTLNLIISWMIPYLKNQEYDDALVRAVTNIGLGLSGWEISKDDPTWGIGVFFSLVVSICIIFSLVSGLLASRKQHKRLKQCKDVLARIKEEQDKVQNKEWSQHKTCPVCFERFEGSRTQEDRVAGGEETSALLSECPPEEARVHVPRLVLQCGHSICEPCLKTWMERNRSCPVCRHPIEDSDELRPSERQRRQQQEDGEERRNNGASIAAGTMLANDVLMADLMYRLRRVQHMYPEYVSDDLIDAWNSETSSSGTFDVQRFSDHQVRNQAIAAAQTERGRFGSSTSFGGGRGGGGGAGGSW